MKLHWLFNRFMAPAGDEGTVGGSAAVDRGDDWVSSEDVDTEAAEKVVKEAAKEPEAEAKDDEDDAADDEEDDKKGETKAKAKDSRLPLSRHKEILQRERDQRAAVESELAKYKSGAQIAATNETITAAEDKLVKMEVEYQKLIADGETKDAAAKMREIRTAERGINDARTNLMVQAAEARAVETVRYDTTVERLEAAYPSLNPDHDDFDKSKAVEIMELKTAYQTMGHPPSVALQKAVKQLMPAQTAKQEAVVETEARVDKDAVAKQLAKDRKAAAVAKNAEVAGKQPPTTNKVGLDSDKTGDTGLDARNVMKMSQDDFRKLTDNELAKMRGDELV